MKLGYLDILIHVEMTVFYLSAVTLHFISWKVVEVCPLELFKPGVLPLGVRYFNEDTI